MCNNSCSCCKTVKETVINKVYATSLAVPGEAGDTPYIGVNGNWWIGAVDTGVQAEGEAYIPELSDDLFTL